jgi:C4-dicarboxylate anaerobic carrier
MRPAWPRNGLHGLFDAFELSLLSWSPVTLGDGIGLRLIMYVVMTAVALLYVLRYAQSVKNDPAKSLVPRSRATRPCPAGRPGRRSR